MTDLDTRLRADADRTPSVPDFAAALAAATRSRRPSTAWWAAAAAVVLVAVGAGLVAVAHGSDAHRAATPASGGPSDAPSIIGAIISPTSSAPEQLMIVISQPAGTCQQADVSVQETATEVTVHLTSRALESGSAVPAKAIEVPVSGGGAPTRPPVSVGHGCGSDPYTAAVLGTDTPLGSRRLVDAATGKPIAVFATTVPSALYLPDGYSEPYPQATDPMSSATLDYRPGALSPITLGRFYRNAAGDRLTVVAAPSADVVPGAAVVDTTTVDGHDATVTETATTRCVTWAPKPDSGLQVCSDVGGVRGTATGTLLDEQDLLTVARSLH
jgi:hypothetical protein